MESNRPGASDWLPLWLCPVYLSYFKYSLGEQFRVPLNTKWSSIPSYLALVTKGLLYWNGFLLPKFSRLGFHFHSLPGPGKIPGEVGTPPITPTPGKERKEKDRAFFLFFSLSLLGCNLPPRGRAGKEGGWYHAYSIPPHRESSTCILSKYLLG